MDLSVYHVTPLSIFKKKDNYYNIITELLKVVLILTISCIRLLNVSSSLKISKIMRDI